MSPASPPSLIDDNDSENEAIAKSMNGRKASMGCKGRESNHLELLANGAVLEEKEEKNNEGATPLHKACSNSEVGSHFISVLLENGASLTKNNNGETPLHVASSSSVQIDRHAGRERSRY